MYIHSGVSNPTLPFAFMPPSSRGISSENQILPRGGPVLKRSIAQEGYWEVIKAVLFKTDGKHGGVPNHLFFFSETVSISRIVTLSINYYHRLFSVAATIAF